MKFNNILKTIIFPNQLWKNISLRLGLMIIEILQVQKIIPINNAINQP